MDIQSFYYFHSTTAQVLASVSALLAVFTHYKVSEIKEFLVGDGKATYERVKNKDVGYVFLDEHEKHQNRFRDSIGRRSIVGIKKEVKVLAEQERDRGETRESKPTGLQALYRGFEIRVAQINNIKKYTKRSLVWSLIGVMISLLSLLCASRIVESYGLLYFDIALITVTILVYMVFTTLGVSEGLKDMGDVQHPSTGYTEEDSNVE